MSRFSGRLDLSVYVVTDPNLSNGRSHEEVASAAYAGGAGVVQLRDKGASTADLYETGLRMQELAKQAGALLVINDRIDVAQATDAGGLHLGQDDMPVRTARELLGRHSILGVSVENADQAEEAERDGASYLAIGPIYEARSSKADAGPPVGPDAVAAIGQRTKLPVIAIGGIKHENVQEVISAGAAGVAVITAIVNAHDITEATRRMRKLVDEARRH